jgi:hypothetical protein
MTISQEFVQTAAAHVVREIMNSSNFDINLLQSTPAFIEMPALEDALRKAFKYGGGFTIGEESFKPFWLAYYNPDFSIELIGDQVDGAFEKVKINPGEVKKIAAALHTEFHSRQLSLF